MHYSRHINRPPDEASNILLQVTTGCSHNKCSFCKIYHDENFCMSPIEHVIEDLEALKRLKPTSKRVWLLNGDPFVLSYQKLVRIAELIHAHLDNIETIGMYVSIRNIKNKTVKELKHLRTLGMTGFHVGVESGDDDALKIATTGYNREDVYEQLSKLEQAGMDYQIGIIAGLGGSKTAIKVGKNTAELLNSLNPKKIIYNALFLLPGSRLENSKIMVNLIHQVKENSYKKYIRSLKTMKVTATYI